MRGFAARYGITLNTLVQGAWSLVLANRSGSRDVIFGATVSGRPPELSQVEQRVGLFINTLPMRVNAASGLALIDWLKAIQEQASELTAYEYFSLETLHRFTGLPAGVPLFESIVVFENFPAGETDMEFEITDVTLRDETDIPLNLVIRAMDTIQFELQYDADRYSEAAASLLLEQLKMMIDHVATHPEDAVTTPDLLGADERERVLYEWNRTALEYPRDSSIPAIFSAVAARMGDATAVAYDQDSWSYAELEKTSNRFANYLISLGVLPGDAIAVCLEPDPWMMAVWLGALKAGACYVPLDTNNPVERRRYMVRHTAAKFLVARGGEAPDGVDTLLLDEGSDLLATIAAQSDQAPGLSIAPLQLANIIFTSGSTGKPKGVQVSHRCVLRLVGQSKNMSFASDDVWLRTGSPAFDASTWEIWSALLNGYKLVSLPSNAMDRIPQLIKEHRVTTVFLTTSLFHLAIDEYLEQLGGIRYFITGGDVISPDHTQRYLNAHPNAHVVNGYGPTENTTFSTTAVFTGGQTLDGSLPIGTPIANSTAYILDVCQKPVPIGVPGELCLGGDGLAAGYQGRPDLTAERFVPHPYPLEGQSGARLYRTGDLARYRSDGAIEFLGRLDRQLKIQGYRVEPDEVEAILRSHPQVREAAINIHTTPTGLPQMIGYACAREGMTLDEQSMRTFMLENLPVYMLPAHLMLLDDIPLTTTGKIDRRALPEPEALLEADYEPPQTETEKLVAEIWSEILGHEKIGRNTNFFELGGLSLAMAKVTARLSEALEVHVPLKAFFENLTVRELAQTLDAALWTVRQTEEDDEDSDEFLI